MKHQERSESATKKPKVARDSKTGKFDSDPYADPALMDDLVRYVRAITTLEPLLSGVVLMYTQMDDKKHAALVSVVGAFLANLKAEALRSLAVDPQSLNEVKKSRLDAKRLGNPTLEEQQRVQQLANEWLVDVPVTPMQMLQSAPHVVESIMAAVVALTVKPDVEGGAHEQSLP